MNLNGGPSAWVLMCFSCCVAIDLFDKDVSVKIRSAVLEASYRETKPDGIEEITVEKPFYQTKADNPQFGYDVASVFINNGPNKEDTPAVLVSAPGNPSIEFADPGFVEMQNLKRSITSRQSAIEKGNFALLTIDPVNKYNAHGMFGSSLLTVPSMPGDLIEYHLFSGSPTNANCDSKNPIANESVSFDTVGYVFKSSIGYSTRKKELLATMEDSDIEISNACFQGSSYGGSGQYAGLSQANRNEMGFSSHMTKDYKTLLFGAPMFKNQGGFVQILHREDALENNYEAFQESQDLRLFYLCDAKALKKYTGYDPSAREGVDLNKLVCPVDLTYGYSVASVLIPGEKGTNKTYLATGGPRAQGLKGEIKLFHFIPGKTYIVDSFEFLDSLVGASFNTGFGTTIVGADLDGDGYDELLAGEPYYTDDTSDTYNSGCVTIYVYNQKRGEYEYKYTLKSPSPSKSNMFGFKVALLGDADADGGEDILITALNEKNDDGSSGKVYLFSGRSISSVYTYSVYKNDYPTILQEFTKTEGKLFGFSVGSNAVDLDENEFKDFVVGDPGKDNQAAYVFYSSTFIRLLHPEGIPNSLRYETPKNHARCPSEILDNNKDINFCQILQIVVENKGFLKSDVDYFHWRPVPTPWKFEQDFTIDVKISKVPDETKIEVYGASLSAEFGPNQPNEKTLSFYVFGTVPEIYGATLKLEAKTTVKSGNEIIVEKGSDVKGPTVLAPLLTKPIDISISPPAKVSMKVSEEQSNPLKVILGSSKNQMRAVITLKSENEVNFVNGELRITLGTKLIGFTYAKSDPESLVSCQTDLQGEVISCFFVQDRKFTIAKITIAMSGDRLAGGESGMAVLPLNYRLTWANIEKEGEGVEEDNDQIVIQYEAQLNSHKTSGVVAEKTPFAKKNSLQYTFSLENTKTSMIGETEVTIYTPYSQDFNVTVERDECTTDKLVDSDNKCSSSKCQIVKCTVKELGSKAKTTIGIKVTYVDEKAWTSLVNRQSDLWFKTDYQVVGEPDYQTNLYKKPENPSGGETLTTEVISAGAPFPWWIVIVTLLVSIAVVSIVIVVLYRRGFFTKRDPNLIRQDDIQDEEYVDDDQEMTRKPIDFTSAA